jgi:hypothetical protein
VEEGRLIGDEVGAAAGGIWVGGRGLAGAATGADSVGVSDGLWIGARGLAGATTGGDSVGISGAGVVPGWPAVTDTGFGWSVTGIGGLADTGGDGLAATGAGAGVCENVSAGCSDLGGAWSEGGRMTVAFSMDDLSRLCRISGMKITASAAMTPAPTKRWVNRLSIG